MNYTDREKQEIFIKRTQEKYPLVWKKYLELVAHEKWSPDQLHEYDFNRRQELVKFAYANTPFYRKLYDAAGIGPEGIKTEDDWDKLPIVTKDMLREHFEEFIVGGVKGEVFSKWGEESHTGGSTGIPLKVYRDKRFPIAVLDWRMRRFLAAYEPGVKPGDERFTPIIGVNEGWIWRTEDWKICKDKKLYAEKMALYHPMKKFFLEARGMHNSGVTEFLDSMHKYGMSYITGYAGAVDELARFIIDEGLTFSDYPFAVSTVSTPLTPTMRNTIQKAFRCEVGNTYGANEFSWMASTYCGDDDSMYVFNDINHIDIVGSDNHIIRSDSIEGCVCVSAFENRVMPFVKYCLNDRARWLDGFGSSDGGRMPFPRMAALRGRESDYLLDKNGEKVFGISTTFDNYPDCVKAYRFVQKVKGYVTVLVVPNKAYACWREDIGTAVGKWRTFTGENMQFIVEEVDSLPHDGGKLRFIVREC